MWEPTNCSKQYFQNGPLCGVVRKCEKNYKLIQQLFSYVNRRFYNYILLAMSLMYVYD